MDGNGFADDSNDSEADSNEVREVCGVQLDVVYVLRLYSDESDISIYLNVVSSYYRMV